VRLSKDSRAKAIGAAASRGILDTVLVVGDLRATVAGRRGIAGRVLLARRVGIRVERPVLDPLEDLVDGRRKDRAETGADPVLQEIGLALVDNGGTWRRTIQCRLSGKPVTTAGPKARAVFIEAPVKKSAKRWHAKSVRPTPTGAKGVASCFSAPSMSTARQRAAVMNISMKTAWALLTPGPGTVLSRSSISDDRANMPESAHLDASCPGRSARTSPEAAMAPVSCAMQYMTKRTGVITPERRRARETFGLNRPPVARKKSHAEMSSESPNTVAMYLRRCQPSSSQKGEKKTYMLRST
jgi:hypothetical protein